MGIFSVSLTDFGRIESAKIDVSKFMVFVGENNTGKSYVLQLMWGIIENRSFILVQIINILKYICRISDLCHYSCSFLVFIGI